VPAFAGDVNLGQHVLLLAQVKRVSAGDELADDRKPSNPAALSN
jgi:hypothetical protein